MKSSDNWFKTLLSYAKGSGTKLVISVILSVISLVSGIVPYFCVYKMLDAYMTNGLDKEKVIFWGGLALGMYFIKVLAFGLSTGISHHVAFNVLEGMRLKVADVFMKAPLGEVYAHSIGEIKGIIVDKIENIEPPLAHFVPEGSGHLVLPIVSFVALCMIDIRVALGALAALPIGILFMALTFSISGKNLTKYQEANAHMNSVIVEYIEGIEVIKAFGKTGVSYEKYAGAIMDYRNFVIEWMKDTWVTMKLAFAFMPATLLGVVPISVLLIDKGSMTVSEMALAVMLAMSMVISMTKIEVFSNSLREMEYTVKEIQKLFDMKTLSEPRVEKLPESYDVKLKNVHFTYDEKEGEVLHGIDLALSEGSFTALVGPSGGGKSTVAKLIARFWDTTSGSIEIGGVDIKDMKVTSLANLVSFVTQDNFLFRCSLLENIRLGNPNATDEEVKAAARAACCEEFILKLPDGYNTSAGEAGKRLSGGERQRIAIARMMLKNAPIVILDEATAFTDPENEDKLQQSITALTKNKTLLVIAHRLSTIKEADNIVVLSDGRIEASGKQDELMEKCPLYNRMWQAHIGARKWSAGKAGR
ncbi:ABC transporter ATP-binding protein [Eubacterium ruminantium]|uniref:ABC transporter ATP-binding protein n=1 Tax=Eubacterium ruminantium TaxID=42322 RepID=UPI00247A2F2A|nr:ABC transporter ATP-binding protein [Eubacterium ruminantium]